MSEQITKPERSTRGRVAAGAVIVLASFAAFGGVANAEPTDISRTNFDRVFNYDCANGRSVTERFIGSEDVTRLSWGQLTQVHLKWIVDRSDGLSFESAENYSLKFPTGVDEVKYTGLTLQLTLPGKGVVTNAAGVKAYENGGLEFSAGPDGQNPNLCTL